MKSTTYHASMLDRLAAQPNLIVMATKRTPQLARRVYSHQLEFLTAMYGLTAQQFDQLMRTQLRYV